MPQPIVELERFAAVSPEPHSIAVDGETILVASRVTRRVDVIDRTTWTKRREIDTPGMPWGMTSGDGVVAMTCGEGPDDNRRIHRFTAVSGFDAAPIACPDDTGSHLALYDGRIVLGQWYNRVLLLLDDTGAVLRSIDVPHGIAGIAVKDGAAYLVTTDDEDAGDYWITRVDLESGASEDIALVPFPARGLAWDGNSFWTNYRAADQTIRFRLP